MNPMNEPGGTFVNADAFMREVPRNIVFTTASTEPVVRYAITGTDINGNPVTECIGAPVPPPNPLADRLYAKIARGAYHTKRRERKARLRWRRAAHTGAVTVMSERAFRSVTEIVVAAA